jgi:outer membrane protein assembly factor BamA
MLSAANRIRRWTLLALMAGHTAIADIPAGNSADLLTASILDVPGARIGTITISNSNVFDLDNPGEDKALHRFANRVHITTRQRVIAEQLLFQSGDKFSPQAIEESERLIRSNRYIQEASVKPIHVEGGVVDIVVETSDTWTLEPRISLSRSGGTNKGAIGLREMNLFGTGMAVEAQYKSDVDRDRSMIRFRDRNLGHSRYALDTVLADNSDGHEVAVRLDKPFYALDSRDAIGFRFRDEERIESFYDRGERSSEYGQKTAYAEFMKGWSKGLVKGWVRRYTTGLSYDENRFSEVPDSEFAATLIPEDRRLVYPFIGIEILEDRYEKTNNTNQIGRTEDRFLGTRLSARLGLASSALGSDRNAWILDAAAQTGFGSSKADSLLLGARFGGRVEEGVANNISLDLSARYYRRQSDHRLLYAKIAGTFGNNLDLDQYNEIGGDSGLRGYPLRYQTGEKRVLVTAEQRFFSDWYPFRLFHVGGAIFFDAGRAWGNSPVSSTSNKWLRDVGLGLRLGNTRSGLGRMTHIDVAFPLDGDSDISNVQFLVSTQKSF